MDPAKLKVVELRSELSKRGLDTKGNKPVLIERLRQALILEGNRPESKAQSESGQKSEQGTDSEDDGSNSETKSQESKLPPRTPSRASRQRSREPTTPVRTPTRRSSSRSSLSRQSPAKTILTDTVNETGTTLEPIVEEDKSSPKKEDAGTRQKQEIQKEENTDLIEKDEKSEPVVKEDDKEQPKTVAEISLNKEDEERNESPVPKDEQLEIVKEAEKHVIDKPQEITRENADDIYKKTNVNQSPSKSLTESAVKPVTQSPVKSAVESPAKTQAQSPMKSAVESPARTTSTSSPVKLGIQSPAKLDTKSPVKLDIQSPTKYENQNSIKVESPVKPDIKSPSKPDDQNLPNIPIKSPVKSDIQSPAKADAQNPVKADVQSPVKVDAQSPVKVDTQSPVKSGIQSPAKLNLQSPVKPDHESPDKLNSQHSAKLYNQSPLKIENKTASPIKAVNQSPTKSATPQKVQPSPTAKDLVESPHKRRSDVHSEKNVEDNADSESTRKSIHEPMDIGQENDVKPMDTDEQDHKERKSEERSHDRKRKRSPSPREEAPRAPPIARPENEPNFDDNAVLLSWYDSDLNLVINPTNYFSASPMQGDGFNFMWAGARASHSFNKGKVYFEARINSEFNNIAAAAAHVSANSSGAIPADEEKIPSLLRLGWSTMGTSLQLGEEKLSYGFEGTGKKATNKNFEEYGKPFAKNDVVGCYADFETDGNITLTYTVNGETQGPAFVITKEELEGKALFPHVLSKNCSFTVNFGQEEHWSQNVLDGYQFIGKIDLNDRIVGPRRPEKREDCEIILICGLPFSGKTSWVTKHVAEHPEKMYSVLGTTNLIEKMNVEGRPMKDKFSGRWENVVEKCTRALTKLLDSAPSRRRNYILDQQANVYGSAQRRKMRNFYGFHRKAVIIMPTDEELKSRIAKRKEAADGEEIRESSILEMKANLSAPTVGESFEEVIWAELGEEEGKKLIEAYNAEGKEAGHDPNPQQPSKRSRFDNGQKDRNNRDNRDMRDNRRQSYNDRRNSGAWRGGGGGGGGGGAWRDSGRMRGSGGRHSSSYGSQGGWRSRGGSPAPSSRGGRGSGNDRRQGNDRNRSGGQRGWNAMGYQGNQSSNVWSGQGSWQGQSQSGWGQQSGSWNQQQSWSGSGSGWKGYGQSSGSYGQSASGYGNGNWNDWNHPQYYNQYWGGQQQQQSSGQTGGQASEQTQAAAGSGGQASTYADGYDFSSDWQDYGQSYDYSQTASTETAQQDQRQQQ